MKPWQEQSIKSNVADYLKVVIASLSSKYLTGFLESFPGFGICVLQYILLKEQKNLFPIICPNQLLVPLSTISKSADTNIWIHCLHMSEKSISALADA